MKAIFFGQKIGKRTVCSLLTVQLPSTEPTINVNICLFHQNNVFFSFINDVFSLSTFFAYSSTTLSIINGSVISNRSNRFNLVRALFSSSGGYRWACFLCFLYFDDLLWTQTFRLKWKRMLQVKISDPFKDSHDSSYKWIIRNFKWHLRKVLSAIKELAISLFDENISFIFNQKYWQSFDFFYHHFCHKISNETNETDCISFKSEIKPDGNYWSIKINGLSKGIIICGNDGIFSLSFQFDA